MGRQSVGPHCMGLLLVRHLNLAHTDTTTNEQAALPGTRMRPTAARRVRWSSTRRWFKFVSADSPCESSFHVVYSFPAVPLQVATQYGAAVPSPGRRTASHCSDHRRRPVVHVTRDPLPLLAAITTTSGTRGGLEEVEALRLRAPSCGTTTRAAGRGRPNQPGRGPGRQGSR